MANTTSKLLNIKQAAAFLGVNPGTIRRWALNNTLKGMKVGSRGDWRFTKEDLLKLTKNNHDNRLSKKQEARSKKSIVQPMKVKKKIQTNSTFPIVGIGASAGGLKAFTKLLEAIPPDIGMAFVLVQHLDPTSKSLLPKTLERTTPLPFVEVTDKTKVIKNHIYAMPSESYMTIVDHTLQLTTRRKGSERHLPIDSFLQSLAKHHGKDAIGIVLSGTGRDGTRGLQAIKENEGRTFAQDGTAQFKDMPQSAIDSGSVEFTLPPDEIARTLVQISREITNGTSKSKPEDHAIDTILALLHTKTGMDFRKYKQTTVNRRIQRRMLLNHVENVHEYHAFLEKNPSEVDALHKDMLIHVTNFFRTPEQFEVLKKSVFPALFNNRSAKKSINIWVPGCATGEEVYSLAIVIHEFLRMKAKSSTVHILGTDIAKDAIEQAIKGVYQENITEHVSPIRIRKFFTKVTGGYKIKKSIRDMCDFAVADVTQKPPRLNNDLASCRNVLIYLGESLQQKALFMLSSALRPEGFLLLGKSEGLGASANLFSPIDSKQRLYSKKAIASATDNLRKAVNTEVGMNATAVNKTMDAKGASVTQPVLDHQQKIIKLREAVELTREYADEIISELDTMNEELQSTNEELTSSNEELETSNEELETSQEELQTANEEMTTMNEELLTRNEEVARARDYADAIIRTVRQPLVILNQDLRVVSANQSFYKTFQVSAKDTENRLVYELGNKQWDIPHLRRLFEKILPKNTSITDYEVPYGFEAIGQKTMLLNASTLLQGLEKSPLILLAIEDITERKKGEERLVESEKRYRILFDLGPVAVYSCDTSGVIQDFNHRAVELWQRKPTLGDTDERFCGSYKLFRPDGSFMPHEQCPMAEVLNGKISEAHDAEVLIERPDGSRITVVVNIRPLKNHHGEVTGAINCFYDITERKKSERELLKTKEEEQAAKENFYSLFMHAPAIVAVLKGPDLVFEMANPQYRQLLGIDRQLDGIPLLDAVPDIEPSLLKILKNVAFKGERFVAEELPILLDWDKNGKPYTKYLRILYEPLFDENKKPYGLMCFGYDVTDQVANRQKLEEAGRSRDEFIGIASHELKTPVTSVKAYTQILQSRFRKAEDMKSVELVGKMDGQLDKLTNLIGDLLDITKIEGGRLQFHESYFDFNELVEEIVEELQRTTERHQIVKTLATSRSVYGDRDRLGQVLTNFITNAIKYSPNADGTSQSERVKIIVKTVVDPENVTLSVQDFGVGISKEEQPKLFKRFYRISGSTHDTVPGIGLGLYIASEIIKRHNGRVWVESKKRNGSSFFFSLPIKKQKINQQKNTLVEEELKHG